MEQHLYFITGIVGVILLLLVNIMNYYRFKFKRNFETEQANRIKFETQSKQLKDELATVQTEFEEEKSKVNRLQENLEIGQASQRQHEAESENLQRQLNTTHAGLEQKQNEVYQLQENLQAERANWITESRQLQHELATIQAELEQKEDRVNRLEKNLEAKQAESEQLQGELNITQVELREKQNEVNHLEENLQIERESRIQYQTKSENLQHELSTTQAELKQKGSEINHLEGNVQAEQAESQQLQRQLDITQAELQKTQTELKQKESENNQLQDSLQAEQATSERLQHELNTTQTEFGEKENEVNHLEENLHTERESRIQYQTESENLQRELSTIQAELEQKESEVSRLQQNLQAERAESERLQRELNANHAELEEIQAELEKNQNEVKHLEKNLEAEQAESEQLQHELATIYQTELDKQKNIISRLEEDLKAEQQSRILHKKKVEQLQHELATTQAEPGKEKKEVNRLQEKNKKQSDVQEIEELSTDSDDLQSQEGTDDSPGTPSNSEENSTETDTTDEHSKTDTAGGTQKPRDIKGRRGEKLDAPDGSTNHQAEYNPKPELICKKNSWQWEILLVVPEEQLPVEVRQNGVPLSSANGEYRLDDFSENLSIMYEDGEETVKVYNGKSPLIFKLRKRWTGDGQKVRGISRGYFILFAPNEWERQGALPVAPEACSDERFSAHYFYTDSSTTTDGFEGHEVPSNQEAFSLRGNSIYDSSNQGVLFTGNPPDLEIVESVAESVSWVRIGEEGGGYWRGENFRDAEQHTVNNALNGREGWFYVRIYDQNVNLIDSNNFRYSRTLREIRINDAIYSEETLLAPCTDGYPETIIQFINAEGNNIRPKQSGNNSHASIRNDDAVIVKPHPDGDSTEWNVDSVDTVIVLPRVWWRIIETDDFSDGWRDKPIDMSREEFHENEDAVVHISVPSNIEELQAGFGSDLDTPYSATLADENENKRIFELPIRDFVDHEEIDTRLLEDTYLQVQFNGEVIPIIRVPAEEPLLQEIRINGITYSEGMLLVPSIDEHGKTIGYGETIIEFIDTGGRNIRPKKKGNNSHASIRNDGVAIVEPSPDGKLTEWEVGSVDKILSLPSVWWRITETEEWRATSVDMSHAEFRENTNLVVQIFLPSSIKTIQAGFGCNLQRSYTGPMDSANENKRIFELPIRDFVNFEEINTRLSQDTHLQIQCNGEVIPIIRVPAEKCSECNSTQITEKRYPTEQRIELFCRTCESKWQIDNTIVSIAEPQSVEQQITGE